MRLLVTLIITLVISCFISNITYAEGNTNLVNEIRLEARKVGIDEDLAVAIAKAESSLNPRARGSKGEVGLFQLRGVTLAYYDPKRNIAEGIRRLAVFKKDCQDMGPYWIICYNQGPSKRPRYPYLHSYYKHVMKALVQQ